MKKTIALLLSLVMLLALFAGCTQTPTNDVTPTDEPEVADTSWEDIQNAGKIVVGLDIAFPPMGFKDEGGEIVGYDVDLAKALGETLGLEVELKPIDWSMKESELNTGKIDLIWNGYTITEERAELVHFTPAYLANRQIIVVAKDSEITDKAGMAGKNVGVQGGSSAIDAMKADAATYETFQDNISEYPDNMTAFVALETARVDCVVMDEVVARYYIAQNPDKFVVLEENFGDEEYGIGVRKEDNAFYEKVVEGLNAMKESGKTAEITIKWFGEDISK